MTTIRKYPAKRSKKGYLWEVAYRKPDRTWTRKRGFATQRDAQLWAEHNGVSLQTGAYVAPTAGRQLVSDLGEDWLARQSHWKESHRHSQLGSWTTHVKPRWGNSRIGDIRKSHVESWIAELSARRSPTVVIRAHGILAGILDDAVTDHLLVSNPARGVKNLPRKAKKENVYLTHRQVDQLAKASGEWGPLVYLACYTGLRWGEIAGLRVKHLTLLKRRILVRENAVEVGRKIVVGSLKNYEIRDVPIPRFLVDILAAHCNGKGPDDLLFTAPRVGGYIRRPKSGKSWFHTAVKSIGIEGRFTPHDMRHTSASLAVQAGANVKVIQRMLGHKSASLTLDVYADLFDDDLDSVAEAMDVARSMVV